MIDRSKFVPGDLITCVYAGAIWVYHHPGYWVTGSRETIIRSRLVNKQCALIIASIVLSPRMTGWLFVVAPGGIVGYIDSSWVKKVD